MEGLIDSYQVNVELVNAQISIRKEPGQPVPQYHITLVDISPTTRLIIDKIRQEIINEISFDLINRKGDASEDAIKQQFREKILKLMTEDFPEMESESLHMLANYIVITSLGLGDLEFLLKDSNLEEIVVNNASEPVWVYHRKYGWLRTSITIDDENKIRHYATMIGRNVDKGITMLEPVLDAHLRTGDRVNATLKPITSKGNTITIRKFAEKPWTITAFIKSRTIDYYTSALIWLAIQYELSIFITGGTGSGKTSALNVFSNFFPPNQRIISIEDTRELQLPNTLHWVPMETRLPNPEGRGAVTMLDLMVNSLRMRPDRIIVGEIRRKEEAQVMFEAMHTGHSVYATFHASNVSEAVTRLTNPPISMPQVLLSALSLLVVQHRNRRTGLRRTFQVAELNEAGDASVLLQYDFGKDLMLKQAEAVTLFDTIHTYTGMSKEQLEADIAEKSRVLQWIVQQDLDDVQQIGLIISDYYTDKPALLKKLFGD